jgi:hypothetical protein
MLNLIYTSNKATDAGASCHMVFIKSWDAMILCDGGLAYKLFRDGSKAVMISAALSWSGVISREGGRHAWITTNFEIALWGADEISGNYHSDDELNGESFPSPPRRTGGFVDTKRNLFIYPYVNSRLHFLNLTTGEDLGYMTLPGPSLIYDHLAWAGEGKIIAIHFATGTVHLIDYPGRLVIWSSVIRPCKCAAYDCLHSLVITVETDNLVRVYTIEPLPAVLSDPVFVPTAASMHRLMGSKVRTRLTGDAEEICPGYWVHWSLLGLPAKGELLRDKSKTDAEGYAENYYFGPRAVGETGEATIQVSVKVPS